MVGNLRTLSGYHNHHHHNQHYHHHYNNNHHRNHYHYHHNIKKKKRNHWERFYTATIKFSSEKLKREMTQRKFEL